VEEYERLRHGVFDHEQDVPLSLWDRFGLFMRVRHSKDSDSKQPESPSPRVSLTLFGAGEDMKIRLRQIVDREGWEEVLRDPYILLDVILDELYLQMDRNVQDVSGLFGGIESVSGIEDRCESSSVCDC